MENKEEELKQIIQDIFWMAVRYAHGRHTFAPHTIRENIKNMQKLYPDWKPKKDHTIQPPEKDETDYVFRDDYLDDIFNPQKE